MTRGHAALWLVVVVGGCCAGCTVAFKMDGTGEVYNQPKRQSVSDLLVAQSHQISKDKVTEYQFDLQKAYDEANTALEEARKKQQRYHDLMYEAKVETNRSKMVYEVLAAEGAKLRGQKIQKPPNISLDWMKDLTNMVPPRDCERSKHHYGVIMLPPQVTAWQGDHGEFATSDVSKPPPPPNPPVSPISPPAPLAPSMFDRPLSSALAGPEGRVLIISNAFSLAIGIGVGIKVSMVWTDFNRWQKQNQKQKPKPFKLNMPTDDLESKLEAEFSKKGDAMT